MAAPDQNSNLPGWDNNPFRLHAPPLDQPASRTEERWFHSHMDHRHHGRHPVTRRSMRLRLRDLAYLLGDRGAPTRQCTICLDDVVQGMMGYCQMCWRHPNPSALIVSVDLANNLCRCPCRCPIDRDSPLDLTWQPENNETRGPGFAPYLHPDRPVAHGIFPQDGALPLMRNYMPETREHYLAGIPSPTLNPEFAHHMNEHDLVDLNELTPLTRFVDQAEVAHFLSEGYTRNQIRARFPETTLTHFANYLPPDEPEDDHEARIRQVGDCPHCQLPYTPRDRRAIRRGRRIRWLQQAQDTHSAEDRTEAVSHCRRDILRLRRHMVINICPRRLCRRPMPCTGLHNDWTDAYCSCRCDCYDSPSPTPSKSSDSGNDRPLSDSTITGSWPADDHPGM